MNLMTQTLAIQDSYSRVCIHRTRRELHDLGVASLSEAQEDLFLAHTPTTRYQNPFLQLLYLARRSGWGIRWSIFELDRPPGMRSILSLSFPDRKETSHLPSHDPRRKEFQRWRFSAQRLAAAGVWTEQDILFSYERRVNWEKIAEILHTDEEATCFVELLCRLGTFYWWMPDKVIQHEVTSKSVNRDGTPCSMGTAIVFEDRRTRRKQPKPDRHRFLHLTH